METLTLIKQIKDGNQKAFRMLIEQYKDYAYRLTFRILCHEEDARDSVQESFIKIWQNIDSYNPTIKLSTWMYKIITNTAIDKYRSIKRFNNVNLNDISDRIDYLLQSNLEKSLDDKEAGLLIRIISEGLPEKQKLIFILRDLEGRGSKEVEQILDLPENSIKSNLYHARKTIREKLNYLLNFERSMQ